MSEYVIASGEAPATSFVYQMLAIGRPLLGYQVLALGEVLVHSFSYQVLSLELPLWGYQVLALMGGFCPFFRLSGVIL